MLDLERSGFFFFTFTISLFDTITLWQICNKLCCFLPFIKPLPMPPVSVSTVTRFQNKILLYSFISNTAVYLVNLLSATRRCCFYSYISTWVFAWPISLLFSEFFTVRKKVLSKSRRWRNLGYKSCFISIGPDFKILCADIYTFTITYDQGNLYKLRYVLNDFINI